MGRKFNNYGRTQEREEYSRAHRDFRPIGCLDRQGKLQFGKYRGVPVQSLKRIDQQYFQWACKKIEGFEEGAQFFGCD